MLKVKHVYNSLQDQGLSFNLIALMDPDATYLKTFLTACVLSLLQLVEL